MIADGESSAIQPGQNTFTIRCVDTQLTFSANGIVLADASYLAGYQRTAGKQQVIVGEQSQVRISEITAKVFQPAERLPAVPRLNSILLPVFKPGQVLYQLKEGDFIQWGFEKRAWTRVSGNYPKNEASTIIYSGEDKVAAWLYQPWIGDMPVEVGMQVELTSKGGAAGLICRYTEHGRYEFLVQPDGRWFIRRNSSYWQEPRSERIAILAHGQGADIQPGQNHMVAACLGNDLRLILNGVELGSVQDYLYPEGQVGILFDTFAAGTFTNLTVKVAE